MYEKPIHNPYVAGIMSLSIVGAFVGVLAIVAGDSSSSGFTTTQLVGMGLLGFGVHSAIVLLAVLALMWRKPTDSVS
ncbi:hypothetical protein [Haloechinothrix halophila]|uniref:hypothetical protein n=1 Tax=Haloechinothrix halophila TaxID=1069073 RepID=UPI0003FC1CB3|nr:hypothetical protein [Haloechinothrix halophila]